jgi:tetratricopeptide (TPR) repeat protein
MRASDRLMSTNLPADRGCAPRPSRPLRTAGRVDEMVGLPPPRLVGREGESAALRAALAEARDDTRVVSVTGPIGVGKSVLAAHVAASLERAGVFERTVRLDASAGPPTTAGVAADLAGARSRGVVVILDGCDVSAPGPWIDAVLAAEPAAAILVTARAALHVAGEIVVELHPFPVPQGDDPEGPALDCLAAHLPNGALPSIAAERAAVSALLRELDGLPLAIALAAPRLALMDARTLVHRLQRSRSVLERPGATPAERRPLESAVGGAIAALTSRARAGLAAITALAGPAPIEALERIVGPPSLPGEPRALDVVSELRERALLVTTRSDDGAPRLAMLRCVRDIVERTCDAADLAAGRDRHVAYFSERAQEQQRRAASERDAAQAAIRADRAEILCVLERVASSPVLAPIAVDRALRLLVAVYGVPGALPPAAFLAIIDAAVDRTKDSGAEPGLVAQALVVRARALRASGNPKGATRDLLRALQIAVPARRRDVEAEATSELAHLFSDRGDIAEAVDHARRASLAWRDVGETTHEAVAAAWVGDLERRRGRLAEARDAIERAMPLAAVLPGGAPFDVFLPALRLHLEVGDAPALHAAIAAARAAPGDRRREGIALLVEAVALHGRDELVAGRERYAAAATAARDVGAAEVEAEVALFDAIAALALGRRGEALARLRVAADHGARGPAGALGAIGTEGALVGAVDEIAASIAFALDTWTTPAWRGPAPAPVRSRLARELVAGADADRDYASLRPVLHEDGDARIVVRLLDAALGGRAADAREDPGDVARFDVDGLWFRLPAEPTVALDKRKPLAAMLKLLVAERLARPGSPISVVRLLAAGWPGERVQADAGAHRVRVALSTLRKLGLRAVLVTMPDGYALDPARKITTATEAP